MKNRNFPITHPKNFIACFVSVLVFLLNAPFSFGQEYVLNGNATLVGDNCYRLTASTTSQSGSVWLQSKITLNADLVVEGTLNFGTRDANGADGMAFVLQPICNGLGVLGGGIGYQGITPSLAVEFDTWRNTSYNDPYNDHIALMKNGVVRHNTASNLQGPVQLSNLENGANHPFKIQWTASSNNLKVYLDGQLRINYTADIAATIFAGNSNVFWGFTGATGAAYNNQTVCFSNVSFSEEGSYVVTPASCPENSDGAIDLNSAGGVPPFSYTWSNGAVTEDISGLSAGTYTVIVTDGNNCQSSFSIEVPVLPDTTPPQLSCPAISASNATGQCGAVVDYAIPEGTDNCDGTTTVQTGGLGSGAFFPVGTTTETYTATDASGNTASCSFTVTVVDDESPVAVCQDITVAPDDQGNYFIDVEAVDAGSVDNCGIASIGVSPQTIPCFHDAVEQTVILTVVDIYGNENSCEATVTLSGDADCDGVGDFCDECPGGDDQVDNNNDGLPDCAYPPDYEDIIDDWKCARNKVYICHNDNNPHTICVSKNAIPAHLAHGDYLGPCDNAVCLEEIIPRSNSGVTKPTAPVFDFGISPNPAHDQVTIALPETTGAPAEIFIYDLLGKLVFQTQTADALLRMNISESQFDNGLYMVAVKQNNHIETKRLLIVK